MVRNNGSSFHSSFSSFRPFYEFLEILLVWIIKRRWNSHSSSFSFVLELDKGEKLKTFFFFVGKKIRLERSRKFPFGKGRNKFKADKRVRNGVRKDVEKGMEKVVVAV